MNIVKKLKLSELNEYAENFHVPVVCNKTGVKLFKTVKKYKPKTVLEIGTAIGFSGTIILSAYEQCKLTTLEINKERADIAVKTFKEFGLSNKVNLIT